MPPKKIKEQEEKDENLYNVKPFVGKKGGPILVIVESPGKIKKLSAIFGDGYIVASSCGHIIDLHPKKLSIDIDNSFEPSYFILQGEKSKLKIVKDLRYKASLASKIILAPDKDREGAFIAWSYMIALNLQEPIQISFNSITKKDIMAALNNPGKINQCMVNSQKARRIIDRLVGFKISPLLNKLVGGYSLSAGRVQSIVVKLICEKEEEIAKFLDSDNASFFKLSGKFKYNGILDLKGDLCNGSKLCVELLEVGSNSSKVSTTDTQDEYNDEEHDAGRVHLKTLDDAKKLMQLLMNSTFKIVNVTCKRSKRYPLAPYTTSTVQQDCSTKLNMSVKRTMTALQKLYEAGHTTYLRTDSTCLSTDALDQCKKFINNEYGEKYYNRKEYVNKKGNTQEAHEAIRPCHINVTSVNDDKKMGVDEQRVYELVWKRTVASQMSPAEVDVYCIQIAASKVKKYVFVSKIEKIIFDGYLAVYHVAEKEDAIIPEKDKTVEPNEVTCVQDFPKPPMRYSEAGLIKKMDPKNLNIGRPATYAEIINVVQKRGYVEIADIEGKKQESIILSCFPEKVIKTETKSVNIGKETKKFVPTQLGKEITKILCEYFPDIMDYAFTANMENELDEIADGEKEWTDVLKKFWDHLVPSLEKMKDIKPSQKELGNHPITGQPIVASIGRYGPMLTMLAPNEVSNVSKEVSKEVSKVSKASGKKIIAPIKAPYTYDAITLEEATAILAYPKMLGKHEDQNVELKKGRYGFYVVCGSSSVNVPETENPENLTLETAIELLEKKKENAKKHLYYKRENDTEYTINTGKTEGNRYLMIRKLKTKAKPIFVTIKPEEDITNMTLERIKEIAATKKKPRYAAKKAKPKQKLKK